MHRVMFLLAVAALSFACILGCNQETPNTSDDGGTADGDVVHPDWVWQCNGGASASESDGLSHYPLPDDGVAKWSYRHFGGYELGASDALIKDDDSWENITMEPTEYDGSVAYVMEDTPTQKGKVTRNWIARRGDRIARVHKKEYYPEQSADPAVEVNYYVGTLLSVTQDVDEYTDGFVRFSNEWIGSSDLQETLGYNRMVTLDLTGDEGGLNKEGIRVHSFSVESTDEIVTVPAGTFENCVLVRRERLRDPGDNASENERRGDAKRYWFCPGVGKVKEEEDVDNPRTEELLYYCIPGGLCCD